MRVAAEWPAWSLPPATFLTRKRNLGSVSGSGKWGVLCSSAYPVVKQLGTGARGSLELKVVIIIFKRDGLLCVRH